MEKTESSCKLFDSFAWETISPEELTKSYLECTEQTEQDFASKNALEEAVNEWAINNTEEEWNYFLENLRKVKGPCVVTGYFMSWSGPQEGGKVYSSLEAAAQGIIMDDSHPIFSITKDGVLLLDETHHDAPCKGNHYEFRLLNAKGKIFYEKYKNQDRRSLCEALKLQTKAIPLSAFHLTAKDFSKDTK